MQHCTRGRGLCVQEPKYLDVKASFPSSLSTNGIKSVSSNVSMCSFAPWKIKQRLPYFRCCLIFILHFHVDFADLMGKELSECNIKNTANFIPPLVLALFFCHWLWPPCSRPPKEGGGKRHIYANAQHTHTQEEEGKRKEEAAATSAVM